MQKFKFFLLVILIAFLLVFKGNAQDSIAKVTGDTVIHNIKDSILQFHHSPTRAAILSAVLPGAGQIYNRKAWKVPLLYAGFGTLGYFIVKFNNLYREYQNAYIQYYKFNNSEILKTLPRFRINSDIKAQFDWYKNTYRRWRDMDIMLFGAVYILNIIDATVDAYLFNYDISDDLSLRLEPTLINTYANKGTPGLKLCLKL